MEKEEKKKETPRPEDMKDRLLSSEDGYFMPFPLKEEETADVTLGYGEQVNPLTGQKFFHQGIDMVCEGKPLLAMATGVVCGLGHDGVHEDYMVCKYGAYEVIYGHLSAAYRQYGTKVRAGEEIARSGRFLHLGVRFKGEYIDPTEFLEMVWSFIQQLAAMGISLSASREAGKASRFEPLNEDFHTKYDRDKDEIIMMFLRWFPYYVQDVASGSHLLSPMMDVSLRNVLATGAEHGYFFEKMPTPYNPIGMTSRALPLAEKVQEVLISDFLGYVAMKYGAYPSSWSENEKKNFLVKLSLDNKEP